MWTSKGRNAIGSSCFLTAPSRSTPQRTACPVLTRAYVVRLAAFFVRAVWVFVVARCFELLEIGGQARQAVEEVGGVQAATKHMLSDRLGKTLGQNRVDKTARHRYVLASPIRWARPHARTVSYTRANHETHGVREI